MTDNDDRKDIQVNRNVQNISTISVKEMAMEKRSMKKDSEMEHGDRSGDYSITDINSNNLSVDVGKKDVELTMERAVTISSEI